MATLKIPKGNGEWEVVGGVGTVGNSDFSVNFNDTDNNVSGGRMFRITDIDRDTGIITLDSVDGIQSLREQLYSENYENSVDKDGLYASIKLFYNYSHVGKVINVVPSENTIEIEGLKDVLKEIDYKTTGTLDNGEEYDITYERVLWFPYYPDLGTDLSYSDCTFATGSNNIAYASNAVATGIRNVAGSSFSTVFGRDNFSGYADVTEGYGNKNYGTYSHIEGERNSLTCTSEGTHIEGAGNIVDGSHKHVEGTNNISEGKELSHTEGNGNTNPAGLSHVEGQLNNINKEATGSHTEGKSNIVRQWSSWSHTEGVDNTIDGYASHVEGTNNTVLSTRAHAEGQQNKIGASATCAHVEGLFNEANGINSHAQGERTQANAKNSSSAGYHTIANNDNAFVVGKFNAANESVLFSVGCGTSEEDRKNAFYVDESGRTHVNQTPSGNDDVVNKGYVETLIDSAISNIELPESVKELSYADSFELGYYKEENNKIVDAGQAGYWRRLHLKAPFGYNNLSFTTETSWSNGYVFVGKNGIVTRYTVESDIDISDATDLYFNFVNAPLTYQVTYYLRNEVKPYSEGYVPFNVYVNDNIVGINDTANELLDNENNINTVSCVLKLPTTYSQYGQKTRLLMMCHGAGMGVYGDGAKNPTDGTLWTDNENYNELVNTFVNAGYAVFDCNGYSNEFWGSNFWGAPRGVEAWRKAYDYIIANYNVETELSIYGFSMGGLTALNLVMNGFPNVKCIALGSPVLNVEKCYNAQKDQVKSAYGMGDTYESDKAVGSDPISRIVSINNEDYCFTNMPPIKIWFGSDESEYEINDSSILSPVSLSDARSFVNALANSGNYAIFREVDKQLHHISFGAVDYINKEYLYWINRFN